MPSLFARYCSLFRAANAAENRVQRHPVPQVRLQVARLMLVPVDWEASAG